MSDHKKLIYAEDAIETINMYPFPEFQKWWEMLDAVKALPSAQPPRMRARWECKGDPNSGKNVEWVCTHCGCFVWVAFCNVKYCPDCGYYMRDDDMEADE